MGFSTFTGLASILPTSRGDPETQQPDVQTTMLHHVNAAESWELKMIRKACTSSLVIRPGRSEAIQFLSLLGDALMFVEQIISASLPTR